jgi:hypothetical protein
LERQLRTTLQTGAQTFESEQQRLQREFAGGESALERALRQTLQTGAQGFESEQQRLQREFAAGQSALERTLREQMGMAEYTGTYQGQQTMQARQQQQNLLIQLAGILAQGGTATQGQMPNLLQSLYSAFGITMPTATPTTTTPATQTPGAPTVGQLSPDGAYRWTGTSWVPNTTQTGQTGGTDTTIPATGGQV